ncbi:hypothetical protein [Metamycoplasma alkalescens]|uniref:Lipoprotein n=3 Tax=Metamycoplasma alkalescens TaxID=45363 RepID=N9U0W3_9BACT|nr:hypothetical protein [Metamycoplasma alkalescens]ENY54187.1 Hypothetical protein, predicted transmembrane protein [Metamycoplasma alkalescens 14918]PYF43146.1 hypothetical protein BCF88_10411 [Metamycoplasma alkalescens]
MKKRLKKLNLSLTIPLAILLPPSVLVTSCTNKNEVKYESENNEEIKQVKEIQNLIKNLKWEDFYLSKNENNQVLNYKNFTYESFFEYAGEKEKLANLKKIEINQASDKLQVDHSLEIDKEDTLKDYIFEENEIHQKIKEFNANKDDDKKLIVIFRSIKLDPPESAILVWVWLTQKKYLEKDQEIKNMKHLGQKQINLYGHWFYNEEFDKNKQKNQVWKILSYVVPSVAIGGLLLYILIALLVKRKKSAFKNKKRKE